MQTEAARPLFEAVYGPDVEFAATADADGDIIGAIKQAAYQLQAAEVAEAAVATALATICTSSEPQTVSVDLADVGEAVEQPLDALLKAWRAVWADKREVDARLAATTEALREEQAAADQLRDVLAERQTPQQVRRYSPSLFSSVLQHGLGMRLTGYTGERIACPYNSW